ALLASSRPPAAGSRATWPLPRKSPRRGPHRPPRAGKEEETRPGFRVPSSSAADRRPLTELKGVRSPLERHPGLGHWARRNGRTARRSATVGEAPESTFAPTK